MSSRRSTNPILICLLTIGLAGLLLGSPFVCHAGDGHAPSFLAKESQNDVDDDSEGADGCLSVLFINDWAGDPVDLSLDIDRLTHESVPPDYALAGTHLLRGPPGS